MAIHYQEGILTSRIPEEQLSKLAQSSSGPAVSVFMNTQRVGLRPKKDRIKLKNLLNQAEKELSGMGHRSPEIAKILAPAWEQQQNSMFWNHQGEGLALFAGPNVFYCYRLPFSVKEMVLVGRRFHLKPLLPLLCYHWTFYLLALSQKQAKLYRGSPYHLEDVESIDLPQGMDEVLGEAPRSRLNFYNLGRGGQVFHGHGGAEEGMKERLQQYFKKIDHSLNEFLGEKQIPLVLASVEYFLPIYHKANSYPRLLDQMVSGNPEKMKPAKLHSEAWAAASPYFDQERKRDQEKFQELNGTGRASSDLAEVVSAAEQGRVSVLFVASDKECWGSFSSGEVQVRPEGPKPGDVDLLDLAASRVFQRGQRVHLLESDEMPGKGSVAAIFHY